MIFEYRIQMSSPIPSLSFRDSIDTSAGETKRILSEESSRRPIVSFSNDPIVYYYDAEIPFNPSKSRYLEIYPPKVYLPSSNNNSKCSSLSKSHIKFYMTYLCIIFCIILILSIVFFFLLFSN